MRNCKNAVNFFFLINMAAASDLPVTCFFINSFCCVMTGIVKEMKSSVMYSSLHISGTLKSVHIYLLVSL